MLEQLTAKNFISTLLSKQVFQLFQESMITQNIVAFSVTFEELVRRRKIREIADAFSRAFKSGLKIEYRSSFANVLMDICYEYRKYFPFFIGMHQKFENNCEGVFKASDFQKIYQSGCNNYFAIITAKDIATMDIAVWAEIINYVSNTTEDVRAALPMLFNRQIESLIRNEELVFDMSPQIKQDLSIGERIQAFKEQRRFRGSAVEEEG